MTTIEAISCGILGGIAIGLYLPDLVDAVWPRRKSDVEFDPASARVSESGEIQAVEKCGCGDAPTRATVTFKGLYYPAGSEGTVNGVYTIERVESTHLKSAPECTSSMFCEHANECPAVCRCPPNCYCRVKGSCRFDGRCRVNESEKDFASKYYGTFPAWGSKHSMGELGMPD